MDRHTLLKSMKNFGAAEEEIILHTLGVRAEAIHERVILSPGWEPKRLFAAEDIREAVSASPLFQYRIWAVQLDQDVPATFIRAGFGAPAVMDLVLLLGLTPCRRLLFVSSAGAIAPEIRIGDVVIPACSVSGDGASRYLSDDPTRDTFGEEQHPDADLYQELADAAARVCGETGVRWHRGRTMCTDTIIAQYAHLPRLIAQGYNTLDMESAAVFKAAHAMDIRAAALLNVSDHSVQGQSLVSERSAQDRTYRHFVQRSVMPTLIRAALKNP